MLVKSLLTRTAAAYYLLQLRKNQWKSLQELKDIQLKRLKAIVHYAYDYVPYYRRLFKSAKFKPDDLKNLSDLKKIPTTTKKDVHGNYSNIIAKGLDISKYNVESTSGSTGIPLKIVEDQKAFQYSRALIRYAFMECGLRLRDKFVNIRRYERRAYMPNQIVVPSPRESEELDVTVSRLRQIKPNAIYALSNVITSLCTADVSGIDPRLIFSLGETLTKHTRDLVKSTFGIEINDTYGSVEFNRLAFECNEHSGLHMITDCAVMEFLDDGEPVAPGETGEIVVTGLYNYIMPLIRYELGDLGVPSNESCSCARNWPLIKSVEGRTFDIFTLESGRKIYPLFLYQCYHNEIREHVFCISQFQIIQEKRNKIVLKVVKGKEFDRNVITRIKENIENGCASMGEDVVVSVQIVKEIPIESSGKRKKIISLIG